MSGGSAALAGLSEPSLLICLMAAGNAHPAGAAGRIRAAKPGNLSGDYEVLDQSEQTIFSWSFSPFKRSLPPSPVLGCTISHQSGQPVAKRVRKPVLECVQMCPCKSSRRGPETSSNPTAKPVQAEGEPPPPPPQASHGRQARETSGPTSVFVTDSPAYSNPPARQSQRERSCDLNL